MLAATELDDARESLTYWEDRSRRLPRWAIRQRREAREMAARWRGRVAEAERASYGAGLVGTMLLVLTEHRLPVTALHRGRTLARRGAQALVLLAATCAALAVLMVVTVVHALLSIL